MKQSKSKNKTKQKTNKQTNKKKKHAKYCHIAVIGKGMQIKKNKMIRK